MQRAVNRAERIATAAAGMLAAGAFLALGVLWHLDRSRVWEMPRWPAPGFVALREGVAAHSGAGERWVVAVNLGCPHCQATLRRTVEARDARHASVRIAALLVDTPDAPAAATWGALPADDVWWDRGQRWRQRWGHRVYGEVLCFAPDGRFLRMLPPAEGGDAATATAPGSEGGHDRR